MSNEQKADFVLPTATLTIILIASVFGAAVFTLLLLMGQLASEGRHALSQRQLFYLDSGKQVILGKPMRGESLNAIVKRLHPQRVEPFPHAGPFHIFLRWRHPQFQLYTTVLFLLL